MFHFSCRFAFLSTLTRHQK